MNFENLSKEDSDKLIRKGITMPLLVNTSTISDLTILAGKLSDQNTFPIIFRINSIKGTGTINGEENPGGPTVISGEEMYATSTQTNELHLDSISGKHLDTSLRQELTATFNGVENELRSSERMIKVGDTITQQIPYNMMINGLDAAFTITATYKLISIKKGIAKFDIDQTSQFTMNKKGSSQVLTGKGGGHGSMTYDTKRNFPKTISRDLSFDFKMQYKGILMKSKATIVSYYFFSVVNSPAN